jgi:hypothetical protein
MFRGEVADTRSTILLIFGGRLIVDQGFCTYLETKTFKELLVPVASPSSNNRCRGED